MKNEVEERAQFVSFCIEQYAKAKNMTTEDVVNLFTQYGITEHFCEFYGYLLMISSAGTPLSRYSRIIKIRSSSVNV